MSYEPTVVFDLDGVIHSYKKGWQGATVISDPPVEGIREAIQDIRAAGYLVVVVSARCTDSSGIRAVEEYLRKYGIEVDAVQMEKPPAICYIDDRAIQFDGNAANLLEKIKNFKPWYQKEASKKPPVSGMRRCQHFDSKGIIAEGWFLGWGQDYEELRDGIGHFTVAIIEMDDGCVITAPAGYIRFIKEEV